MEKQTITSQAIQRMPYYLQYLYELDEQGVESVSAPTIAVKLNLSDIQVRKDFAAVSSTSGKPKQGFFVSDLIYNMERVLGYHNVEDVILVGAGRLGTTLLHYTGFKDKGFRIISAFDVDSSKIDTEENGVKITHMDNLESICKRMKVQIAMITVPKDVAQTVSDQLVACGIKAIYNFAPVHLEVQEGVELAHVDISTSLVLLSKKIEGL